MGRRVAETRTGSDVAAQNEVGREQVRRYGAGRHCELVRDAECGVARCTFDRMRHLEPDNPPRERRAALGDVGMWVGTLPPRLALEVADAIWAASERSGADTKAVERSFHAKFWSAAPERRERERALHPTRELDHSIEL